jgi:hypothetical protein
MRGMIRAATAALLLIAAPASATTSTAPAPNSYAGMVARLKAGATDVDFAALRRAAVAQPDYRGYDQLDMRAVEPAFKTQDWKTLQSLCEAQLSHDYLDLNAHLIAAIAADKLGQPDAAALHRRIWQGEVDAIFAGGDGKSAKTAFHVLGVDEEYFLLQVLHLKSSKQSLITEGGAFDVLDATDEKGNTQALWFDISPFFGKAL